MVEKYINDDMNGNGNYATYDDGTPVHIKMQMTFKETNPIYAEDYNDDVPGVGY